MRKISLLPLQLILFTLDGICCSSPGISLAKHWPSANPHPARRPEWDINAPFILSGFYIYECVFLMRLSLEYNNNHNR